MLRNKSHLDLFEFPQCLDHQSRGNDQYKGEGNLSAYKKGLHQQLTSPERQPTTTGLEYVADIASCGLQLQAPSQTIFRKQQIREM